MFSCTTYQRFHVRVLLIAAIILATAFLHVSFFTHTYSGQPFNFGNSPKTSDKSSFRSTSSYDDGLFNGEQELFSENRTPRDPCNLVAMPENGVKPQVSEGTLALVTGGAGFIGSNLVDRLLKLGYRVRIYDNLYTGYLRNIPLHDDRVEFILGDILDQDKLLNATQGVHYVYHLAAMSKVLPSIKNPDMARFCVEANALGTWNVLNAVRSVGTVQKVVYAASSTYYGNNLPPHQEDQAPDFLTPYAASKYEGEIQMKMFNDLFDVPTVSTRFFMVYGPRQPSSGAYAIVTGVFAKQAADGRPLTIEGDGTHYRDFIHVDDIVTGLILAQQSKLRGQTINLGTGTKHSVKELADIVSPVQVHIDPRKNDLEGTLADTCRMKRLLGYKPQADFTENMRFMVQETMKGNAFAQSWLSPALAMAAPHLLPRGNPMLDWPKDLTDLDGLLFALGRIVAGVTEATDSVSRRITVLPLPAPSQDRRSVSELLLNTVFSLVKHGRAVSYLVTIQDDVASEICQQLNLPCLDIRGQTHEQLLHMLLGRGYDIHFAQYGNSYFESIDSVFDNLEGLNTLVANTDGDLFIRSTDETRQAFSSFPAVGSSKYYSAMTPKFTIPDSNALSAQSYQVQRLCKNKWSIKFTADPDRVERRMDEWLCSNQLYASVGCSWDYVLQQPNETVLALKAAGLWHLSTCPDDAHCDLQQVIPKSWIGGVPDLRPFGGGCKAR